MPRGYRVSAPVDPPNRASDTEAVPAARAFASLSPLVLALGVSLVATNARADEPVDDPERIVDAAREFEEGRRAYRAGEFASAAAHFESAYRVAPRADALRNAILARQKAKDNARAATLSALGLVRYPDDAALGQLAKPIVAAADKRLHRVDLRCGVPCKVVADKKLAPWADTSDAVLYFEPGSHELAVTWGRKSQKANVEATVGGKSTVKLSPPEDAPVAVAPPAEETTKEPPPPPPPAGFKLPKPAFIALGVTTVLLGGFTTYSAIDMRSDPGKDKVRADCAGRDRSCKTYQDALSAQRRTNILLGVTAGAAVVTAAVGVFLTDWSNPAPSSAKAGGPTRSGGVLPFVSHDGRQGILGATGTF